MRWLPGRYTLLRIGAFFALLALALIVWSFFDHRPIVLVAAMSLGQALGTASFGFFLLVVLLDLRDAHVLGPDPDGDDADGDDADGH